MKRNPQTAQPPAEEPHESLVDGRQGRVVAQVYFKFSHRDVSGYPLSNDQQSKIVDSILGSIERHMEELGVRCVLLN